MTFRIKLLKIKCVLIFSNTFVWNVSHSKKNWDIIRYMHRSSCKVPIILSVFYKNSNFSIDLWKILKYQIRENPSSWSQVIRSWWRDKHRTDGWETQTWVSLRSISAILWVCLKISSWQPAPGPRIKTTFQIQCKRANHSTPYYVW